MRLNVGHVLQGGIRCYRVTEQLAPSPGARGYAYKAEMLSTEANGGINHIPGEPGAVPSDGVFLKTPRIQENAPYPVVQAKLAEITGQFMAQYTKHRALHDLVGEVACVFDWGWTPVTEGTRYSLPFLAQRYVPGTTLRAHLAARGAFHGITDAPSWFQLASQITNLVQRLHNRGLVHGDVSPDNIIIEKGGNRNGLPTLVDFGEAVLYSHEMSGRGVKVAATERRHKYQAPERRTAGMEWYHPADIYSLGAVFYFMATGEDPNPNLPDDIHELKQSVYSEIKRYNDKLLDSPSGAGIAKMIDKCLRQQPYERYAYVESLARALVLFSRSAERAADATTAAVVETRLAETATLSTDSNLTENPFFLRLALVEIERTKRRLETMTRGHVEIVGEREELIDSLLEYLAVLRKGDEYITITAPQLWTDDNLGINGRFLTMNKILAQEGVVIRRIFILCDEDRNDPIVKRILQSHLDMMSSLPAYVSKENSDSPACFYTGFSEISQDARRAELSLDRPVAVWRRQEADCDVSISFALRPASVSSRELEQGQSDTMSSSSIGDRVIGKVRFWSSKSGESEFTSFRKQIDESRPLSEFFPPEPKLTARKAKRSAPA